MLRRVHDLIGMRLHATDGDIGHIRQLFFDDETWTIRHFVVDTGGWLSGREVLISPIAISGESGWSDSIPVNLTREQVKASPDLSTEQPISRAKELEYFQHYGWPYYWTVPMEPSTIPPPLPIALAQPLEPPRATPHLRSSQEVTGYHLHAADGVIGHIEGFLLDDHNWQIRYLVIDTRQWWPGKKVLLSPGWVDLISWEEREVRVKIPREKIRAAPEYRPGQEIDRAFEASLQNHYVSAHCGS